MYFADFWVNFSDFLTIVWFYCLKWALKRQILFEQFLDNEWLQLCGYRELLVENYDKNLGKLKIFLNFFADVQFFSDL